MQALDLNVLTDALRSDKVTPKNKLEILSKFGKTIKTEEKYKKQYIRK